MKKNIWIINHYAGSMYFDKGGRHYNFAKYLKKEGYNPVVFCANSKHGNDECYFDNNILLQENMAQKTNVPFVFVKTTPYAGNGISRVKNMVSFYFNIKKACKEYSKKYGKPDIIYSSSVHPLTIVAGIQLAKHFGVKCIGEVRDLWPESIVEYSTKFTKNNPLIKMLYQGEKWIYKKVDKLIFTIEGGYDYIRDKGWDKAIPKEKVFHINNGVDLEVFNYDKEHFQIEDEDLKNDEIFKVIYTGSIRRANNMGLILEVSKKTTNPRVKFLIYGDGNELPILKRQVIDEKIDNVVFKGRVDKKYIPYIISQSNLNILNYEMHDIWKYGGSQNKLFEYFAGGKPVITNITMGYDLVKKYNAGFNVENATAEKIAAKIEEVAKLKTEEYQKICNNTVVVANEYDFKNLTQELIEIIEK